MRRGPDAIAQEDEDLVDVGQTGVATGVFERVVADGFGEDGDVTGDAEIFGEKKEEVKLLVTSLQHTAGDPSEALVVELDGAVGKGALHDEAQGGAGDGGIGVAEQQRLLGEVTAGSHVAPDVVIHGALRNDGLVVVLAPGSHGFERSGIPQHFAAEGRNLIHGRNRARRGAMRRRGRNREALRMQAQ